jgi:hypothetical protein
MSALVRADLQWFDLLQDVVERAQHNPHGTLLDPPSILDEALQWLKDPREFDPKFHRGAWDSCFADVRSSLTALGPALKKVVEKPAAAALATLAPLPGPNPTMAVRVPAIAALEELAAAFGDPSALAASWRDLMSATKNEATSLSWLSFYADTFTSLLRANSQSVPSTIRLINGVLHDGAWARLEALYLRGDLDPAEAQTWPPPNEAAGLMIGEREELCERLLTTEPTAHHHVVWLAFNRAVLREHPGVTVDQVQFFEAALIRSAVAAGSSEATLPAELFSTWITEREIPDSDEIVLARVDLGTCVEPDPSRRASAIAEALVATARFRTGPFSFERWSELDWFMRVVDGRIVQASLWVPDNELPGSREAYELVGTELSSLAGSAIASANPDKRTIARLDALRWFYRAQNMEPAARLLLDVRILELIASSIHSDDPRWRKYLDKFWQDAWVRHSTLWEIFTAVRDAGRQPFMAHDVDPKARADIDRMLVDVLKRRDAYRVEPNFHEAVKVLPMLSPLFSPFGLRGRRLRGLVSRTHDIGTLQAWVRENASDWQALLDRTQRCRNALAHGGPINDRVMASASHFARTLGGFALGQEVQAVVGGHDLSASHQELADDARAWRALIAAGTTDVASALAVRPTSSAP